MIELVKDIKTQIGNEIRATIEDAIAIRVDNVAQYILHTLKNGKEYFDPKKDFPNLAPPFENFFMWSRLPSSADERRPYAVGAHFRSLRFDSDFSLMEEIKKGMPVALKDQMDTGWIHVITLYDQTTKYEPAFCTGIMKIPVLGNGELTSPPYSGWIELTGLDVVTGSSRAWEIMTIFLMALSFMHCKNVVRKENVPPPKVQARRAKDGKPPLTKYYTLEIEAMKRTLQNEGGISTNGLKRALHICRGHFATYTADKPLFGHYVGTVWKPQHIKGSKDAGEVVKDYSVKGPKVTP